MDVIKSTFQQKKAEAEKTKEEVTRTSYLL
jgi:hypothetical protein